MKRSRGRNRRNGGNNQNTQFNNPNRHYESVGPDVKIRGSAQQVLEKYQQYARDAHTSGDRILSEAYFQYAEHYQRIVAKQTEVRQQQSQVQQGFHNRPPRDDNQQRPDPRREGSGESGEDAEAIVESRHAPQSSDTPPDRDDERSDGMRVIGREDRDDMAEIPVRAERPERTQTEREPRRDRDERRPPRDRTEGRKPYAPREDKPPREDRAPKPDVASTDDGVMKTLSRGRRRPAEDPASETE